MMMKMKPCIEKWDEDEWDENETLHLIMMMVKNCTQKTIYIKKIKKFNYYYPPPCFLFLFFALWK